jgi:thymidylate synthase ThyX
MRCSSEASTKSDRNSTTEKSDTYAKATKELQRLLRVYWVVHNFLRVHFTIREVPAVALGILERRLSVQEIFQIQMA